MSLILRCKESENQDNMKEGTTNSLLNQNILTLQETSIIFPRFDGTGDFQLGNTVCISLLS